MSERPVDGPTTGTAEVSSELEGAPPPLPIIPPPLPSEARAPGPPPCKPKKKKKKKKKKEKNIQDGLWSVAVGIGLIVWTWSPGTFAHLIGDLIPALIAAALIETVRVRWRPEDKGGLIGKAWDKAMQVWKNHGSGTYGLITLLVFARRELGDLSLDVSALSLDPADWISYWFVERWIDAFTNGWQSFLWPLDWLADAGGMGTGGLFVLGYSCFEIIRATFAHPRVSEWISKHGRT